VTLLLDKRESVGSGPGLHLLVAGVGTYATLPTLNSAALSAYHVASWFANHEASLALRLATIRLLLSPSPFERHVHPGIDTVADRCTVGQFREDCFDLAEDLGRAEASSLICYFAGHGALPSRDSHGGGVVFLDDHSQPRRRWPRDENMLAVDDLTEALGRGQPRSQAQLFLIDACRTLVADRAASNALPFPGTRAAASVLFSTGKGQRSWARAGQRTIYCQALIACLEGEAAYVDADGRSVVSIESLARALQRIVPGIKPPTGSRRDEQWPEFKVEGRERVLVEVKRPRSAL
jgi:Caspase domain